MGILVLILSNTYERRTVGMENPNNLELSWLAEILNIPFSKAAEIGIDECTKLAKVSVTDNPFDIAYQS